MAGTHSRQLFSARRNRVPYTARRVESELCFGDRAGNRQWIFIVLLGDLRHPCTNLLQQRAGFHDEREKVLQRQKKRSTKSTGETGGGGHKRGDQEFMRYEVSCRLKVVFGVTARVWGMLRLQRAQTQRQMELVCRDAVAAAAPPSNVCFEQRT